MSKICNHG